MAIAVEERPGSDEGPLRIELASERPLALPEGPHPTFGIVFRQVSERPYTGRSAEGGLG